ncbi:hypothetical protein BKA93DRAFT_739915, partial [Sparassis latifolia]
RYREFLRVSRLWQHLQAKKRSGQALGISDHLPSCYQNQLCVLCPACPHFGINTTAIINQVEQYIYRQHTALFIAMDGNRGLVRKHKNSSKHTQALSDGVGYFPNNQRFHEYLKKAVDDYEVDLYTCYNLTFFKKTGLDVTGIVSVVCSRHGLFLPQGTVDLQKGERFANVDYALAGVLKQARNIDKIYLSYDEICGYCVNIRQCFTTHFPDLVPLLDKLVFLVPKMHILGHKEVCQLQYSFNYTEGVGRTDGEAPERVWKQDNEHIESTKEMDSGHRHDVLNNQHSALNFDKTTTLGKLDICIYKLLLNFY